MTAADIKHVTLIVPESTTGNAAPAGETDALTWLALIDTQNYPEGYQHLALCETSQVNSQDWAKKITKLRTPLGDLVARKRKVSMLAIAKIDGKDPQELKARVVKFKTDFSEKKATEETVIFVQENDHWRILSYDVQDEPVRPLVTDIPDLNKAAFWKKTNGKWEPMLGQTEKSEYPFESEASEWLVFSDVGKYRESYARFAEFAKKLISESDYVSAMEAVRKPLGNVVFRKIKTDEVLTSLPGMPDGDYRVLTFETEFTAKKNAVEIVTFVKAQDGTWLITGYVIQ